MYNWAWREKRGEGEDGGREEHKMALLVDLATLLVTTLLVAIIWETDAQIVNAFNKPIVNGNRVVHTRLFAQIPEWGRGRAARIVSMTTMGSDLYACTDITGALVYKVSAAGKVNLFFNAASAILHGSGRRVSFANRYHGGLRALAFHPYFARNGLLYVSAMEERPANSNAFRYLSNPFRAAAADSVVVEFRYDFVLKRVLYSSYREVLRIGVPVFDHPIKHIAFHWLNLYIAHGDGSIQSYRPGSGQRNDALGKMLRINPFKYHNRSYNIPHSNPFATSATLPPEIYALGFRNPHTFCFSKSGELFVTDVGRDNFEEINIVRSGGNYGWSEREGQMRHLHKGGLISGLAPLLANDSAHGYLYPNVVVGHAARYGSSFVGQALASSCPIENASPLANSILFSDFPSGDLYYSLLSDMRAARTSGNPLKLSSAPVFRPKIFFDHDNNPATPDLPVASLLDVIRMDPKFARKRRVDVRFGQGARGEIYWSSKTNGRIYVVSTSVPAS